MYKEFFEKHKNIKLHVYYPLADLFNGIQKYCRITPLKQIRQIFFHIYKSYKNRQIGKKITKMRFDAVIDYVTCSAHKQLRYIKNAKTVTFIHGRFNGLLYSRTRHFQLYDKIVVLTNKALEDAKQKYPEYAGKFVRIYNIVDTKRVNKISKIKIRDFGKYFLSVSRLDFDKDIATIIKAFDAFYQSNKQPNCKLIIIGDGNNKMNLELLAKQFKSNVNILFLGKIPEPYNYMRNAIAHILSSNSEAFGSVLIESGASETLNIASDCSDGPREILNNGKSGILFQPGNVDELSKIMSDVWHKKTNRDLLIKNMFESIDRFEPKTISKQIMDLIKGL